MRPTVAGGVPIIRTIGEQLQVNRIKRIQAILNGTSNFILTEMRKEKAAFKTVLKECAGARLCGRRSNQ